MSVKTYSNRQIKRRRKLILILFYQALILLFLGVAATYTWLALTDQPRVSSMNLYVNTTSGLRLSLDPATDEWVYQLDYRDIVSEDTVLRPATWSEENQAFYAPTYYADGRAFDWNQLSDEENANTVGADNYYIKATYYMTCGQKTQVSLAPATIVDEEGTQGAGTYVIGVAEWDPENIKHVNTGKGAESAIRVGFRVTYVDKNGEPTGEGEEFFIYEPNYNLHVAGGLTYSPTASMDGTATLVDMNHMILQSASRWNESDPVEHGKIKLTLGTFLMNPPLVSLDADQIARIDMYIWLEGQDKDCTNQMDGATIFANVQFVGDTESQSGIVEIE